MKKVLIAISCWITTLLAAEESPLKEVHIENTLSILKPDAIEENQIGAIEEYFETAGLKVVACKMTRLTPEQAKAFYAEHKDRPFFNDLIAYMTSGPVLVQVLQGEDAVASARQIMGPTDPKKAPPGTIRGDFGTSIEKNAIHGSDSLKSAEKEISFFFTPSEIY